MKTQNKKQGKNKDNVKRTVVLTGEGANLHVLEGEYTEVAISENKEETKRMFEVEEAFIKHETPSGEKAEHETLKVEKGMYVLGRQVEYDPMKRIITNIWD